MINFSTYEKIVIICVLEHLLFKIGVTNLRSKYFESIKCELSFSNEEYNSPTYNQLVKNTCTYVLLEIDGLRDFAVSFLRTGIIGMINSDPYSPISNIGLQYIKRLSNIEKLNNYE